VKGRKLSKSESHWQYSQPDIYHFSEDSVFLSEYALKHTQIEVSSLLDIGAGCGVVGLEFLRKSQHEIKAAHFVESQDIFYPYLEENLKDLDCDLAVVHKMDVKNLENLEFDLILSNPPFYDPTKGRLSENDIQNQCRFSLNLSPKELCFSIEKLLSPKGEAWLLVGNSKEQNHLPDEFSSSGLSSELFREGPWSILRFVKLNEE